MLKRILTIVLLLFLLLIMFVEPVYAAHNKPLNNFLDDVRGFGGYTAQEKNGELYVTAGGGRSNAVDDMNTYKKQFDKLFVQYGRTITWCTGVATITLVAVFIWLCVKNAFVASEHWILKRQTMMAMLWVGVGTALMGSTTLILLIFQNAFK